MTKKLADLQTSLIALGVGLGVGLTIAGIGLAFSGPVAPFILVRECTQYSRYLKVLAHKSHQIGGLIFAGATAAAVAGIARVYDVCERSE